MTKPAVIIVGPPWPQSGTSRVIQNQIEFYRSRGYFTLFVAVAIQGNYLRDDPVWDSFKQGAHEFGADHVAIAALNATFHKVTKLASTVRHGLRGTQLDWIIDIATSARLSDDDVRLVRGLPVALLHVNHVFTLGFALRLREQRIREGARVPIIVETHDVQSHLLHQTRSRNPWTQLPDSLERLIHCEIGLLEKADVLVHLSVDDFEFFRTKMPGKPHLLAMPTIDESFVSAVHAAHAAAADLIDLLFVGQYSNPNLAALEWFLGEVWPRIAGHGYNLKIVGAVEGMVQGKRPEMHQAFRSCFAGPVPDLVPYYRRARCVIAPMVNGSGISIKTIEAFALGKPFVGTSKAFRGMPMQQIGQAGIQAYDDPQAFADAIVRALGAQDLSGASSRAAYDRVFSTQAAAASRDEAVRIAAGDDNPVLVLESGARRSAS